MTAPHHLPLPSTHHHDVDPADLAYATRVARRAAHQIRRRWNPTDLEDLDQEARLAAWRAQHTYNPRRGATWRTYLHLAVWARTIDWCRWWARQNRLDVVALDATRDVADTPTDTMPANPAAHAEIVVELGGLDADGRWQRSLVDVAVDLDVHRDTVWRMRVAVTSHSRGE